MFLSTFKTKFVYGAFKKKKKKKKGKGKFATPERVI